MKTSPDINGLLEAIAELLDIPPSYYEQAEERYRSLAEWLHRDESTVAAMNPHVGLQGSFRYGTVNRPLGSEEEYDLDLFCEVRIPKSEISQKRLKHLIGEEIKAYAERHSFNDSPTERNRCWRLDYADDVSFHMDILPCVPEDRDVIDAIIRMGVPQHLAAKSVAITDRRHPRYEQISRDWLCSNPRGLGDWFEERARPAARARMARLVENKVYATIDDVPAYEWKTPLQRSIQILKRHRDVMFKDDAAWAPISMIITILAARAYQGEVDLGVALCGIVERMPDYVRPAKPRIPNPVNPAEDFADRWASDRRYEENFWAWHAAVTADIAKLPSLLTSNRLAAGISSMLMVNLTAEQLKRLQASPAVPAIVKAAPTVHIASAPRPWRMHV